MLDQNQLNQVFEACKEAARQAEAVIMQHYQGEYDIYRKEIGTHTGDIVTQADHDAQEVILNRIHQLPDSILQHIAIIAEEMPDHHPEERFEKPFVFMIDPLDGTRGFVDRTNSFAVSIGLIRQNGLPVFGVVALPGIGHFFAGFADGPVAMNDQVKTFAPNKDPLVLWLSEAEMFPQDKNALWHALMPFLKQQCGLQKIRPQVLASPVHKGCQMLTEGGLYLGLPRRKKGVSLWDLAAIASLVQGAGGWVSDVYGDPLELNRKESQYVHHRGFVMAADREVGQAVVQFFKQTSLPTVFES